MFEVAVLKLIGERIPAEGTTVKIVLGDSRIRIEGFPLKRQWGRYGFGWVFVLVRAFQDSMWIRTGPGHVMVCVA